MNYNLLEEPWIPVLMRNGEYRRVGIKDALTQAGRIRQVAASNPTDRVATLQSCWLRVIRFQPFVCHLLDLTAVVNPHPRGHRLKGDVGS
jgi:hypothetical protein